MSKLNLAILDGDMRYMENFAGYITGYYRHRFNLSVFSNPETLVNHIRDTGADIVLIAAETYGDWASKLESGLVIILTNGSPSPKARSDDAAPASAGAAAASGSGAPASVDRYSGADKLVADILKIYADNDRSSVDADVINGGRENKILTIFSAEGGSGRTSSAIALCAHFVKQRLRVLFISLDFLGAEDFAFEGDKVGGLSDIIYTIKTRPERLGLKLEALARTAPGHGFFFFNPPIYPMDIDEIQPSDIEILIAKLRGAGLYDRVVVDTHNGLSLRNRTLMELSDGIYILARGNAAGQKKLFLFKTQIDKCFGDQAESIYKRCHIIVNNARITDFPDNGAGLPVYNSALDNGSASAIDAGGIAAAFSAKVSVIPFCGDICNEYKPETLADISNAFGAAFAEVARRA